MFYDKDFTCEEKFKRNFFSKNIVYLLEDQMSLVIIAKKDLTSLFHKTLVTFFCGHNEYISKTIQLYISYHYYIWFTFGKNCSEDQFHVNLYVSASLFMVSK